MKHPAFWTASERDRLADDLCEIAKRVAPDDAARLWAASRMIYHLGANLALAKGALTNFERSEPCSPSTSSGDPSGQKDTSK